MRDMGWTFGGIEAVAQRPSSNSGCTSRFICDDTAFFAAHSCRRRPVDAVRLDAAGAPGAQTRFPGLVAHAGPVSRRPRHAVSSVPGRRNEFYGRRERRRMEND
jgi:hypothetical protein